MKHMEWVLWFLSLSIVQIICFSSTCDNSYQPRISFSRETQEPINSYQTSGCVPINLKSTAETYSPIRDQPPLYTVSLQFPERNFGVHMTQGQVVRDGIAIYAGLTYEEEIRERIRQAQIAEVQKYARVQFTGELPDLKKVETEYRALYELCTMNDIGTMPPYLPLRLQAFDALNNQPITYAVKHYQLTQEVVAVLQAYKLKESAYRSCYGNQLQQVLHQESIAIIARTALISPQSVLHEYKEDVIEFADSARECNEQGSCIKAMYALDFCHTLLDYGWAVMQGVAHGVVGAVRTVVENPIESILAAVSIKYLLIYQAAKLIGNVAYIGVNYTLNHEVGQQQWHEFLQPIDDLIELIKKRELEVSVRDCCKVGAYIVTAVVTQKKLLNRLGRLFKKAKSKALYLSESKLLG